MNRSAFGWALALTISALGLPLAAGSLWPRSAVFWLIIWPYLAMGFFLLALTRRFLVWALTPTAYNTPLTAGPRRGSLKLPSRPDLNPPSPAWVWARLAIEALTFRTLWINLKYRAGGGFRPDYTLAAGAALFHWSLLIILVEHFRFFWAPPPLWLVSLASFDAQWLPVRLSTLGLAGGLLILAIRRLASARLRMISRFEDWLALGWLFNLGLSGLGLAWGTFDLTAARQLLSGLMSFGPTLPEGALRPLFLVHFFQAGLLLIYWPSGKLSHSLALFLNPVLARPNNSRAVRYPGPRRALRVPIRTYAEYETDNRADLLAAGLPLECDAERVGGNDFPQTPHHPAMVIGHKNDHRRE